MIGTLLTKTLLVILPIIIIVVLLVRVKVATHYSALIGLGLTVLIAYFFFSTPLAVSARAGAQGVFLSFPISLMVLFSLMQINYMEAAGALERISVFLKTLSPGNREAQIMIMNLSAGTTLVSVGATPVSVLPPVMRSLGYENRLCIALPALGFDALCTFSMMAAPLIPYCDLTGTGLVEAAKVFTAYLPAVSTILCFGMFYLVGGFSMVKKGVVPALLTGLTIGGVAYLIAHVKIFNPAIILSGVIAGVASICVMLAYLKLKGGVIIDRSVLTEEDIAIEKNMSLAKALSPWIILIAALLVVAFTPPVDQLLRVRLAMPVSMIPNVVTNVRLFWNAYFWVFLSTFLSMLILKPKQGQFRQSMRNWGRRAPKPVVTTIVFYIIGYLLNYSGYQVMEGGGWELVDPMQNMVSVLADSSALAFGSLYPLIVAPLGLFGGFITSSEASTLAMFSKYNILTSKQLGLNALVVTAATGIGGGLASVISPAKLQNAAATIDAIGEENDVIKETFKISCVLIVVVAAMCWWFCKM